MNGIWAIIKETLESPFTPFTPCGRSEKTVYEAALARHEICQSLHLSPPSLQNNEQYISVIFSHQSMMCSCRSPSELRSPYRSTVHVGAPKESLTPTVWWERCTALFKVFSFCSLYSLISNPTINKLLPLLN